MIVTKYLYICIYYIYRKNRTKQDKINIKKYFNPKILVNIIMLKIQTEDEDAKLLSTTKLKYAKLLLD